MKFAYADPPYIGQARKHYAQEAARHGRVASEVDHPALIERLVAEFPDGWALSLKSNSLRDLLPLCPPTCRVLAWVKPYAMFKKNVPLTYAWEPVIFSGGRRGPTTRYEHFTFDWHIAARTDTQPNMTLTAKGAKPITFCLWLLAAFGFQPGDEMIDLFPGTGTMEQAVRIHGGQLRIAL